MTPTPPTTPAEALARAGDLAAEADAHLTRTIDAIRSGDLDADAATVELAIVSNLAAVATLHHTLAETSTAADQEIVGRTISILTKLAKDAHSGAHQCIDGIYVTVAGRECRPYRWAASAVDAAEAAQARTRRGAPGRKADRITPRLADAAEDRREAAAKALRDAAQLAATSSGEFPHAHHLDGRDYIVSSHVESWLVELAEKVEDGGNVLDGGGQ